MAMDPKFKQYFQMPTMNKNEFLELGAEFKTPQQNRDIASEKSYQYRFARSIKEEDPKPDAVEAISNAKETTSNAKDLLSKRKQKLYKNGLGKKDLLKKYSDHDTEKSYKQKKNGSQLKDNDFKVKSQTNEIRSERSLKNKRKSQDSVEIENQKVKRQIEASSLDAQIDKHVKSLQDFNGKIASTLAERANNPLITEQIEKVNDHYAALQNHLKETKERLLAKQNPLPKLPLSPLLDQSIMDLHKHAINSDLLRNNNPLEQIFEKNPLKKMGDDPATLQSSLLPKSLDKEWPLLDHKSIADKIDQDLKALQERLSKVLHNKDLIKTKSLHSEEKNDKDETNEKEEPEVYQPSVNIDKLLKNKRNPLYLKHKEKLGENTSDNIPLDAENNPEREKRAIPDASSKENMILSNSIQQDEDTEDFSPKYEEIAHKIVIIDKTHDPENSQVPNGEEIIIENFDDGNVSKEEIIFVADDNSTNGVLNDDKAMSSLTLIDDMAHKLTDFVTYVQSHIKHWFS